MLICTEAWSLAVMRRFVAALTVSPLQVLQGEKSVPFAGDVEVDNFSLIVFHDGLASDTAIEIDS